VPAVRRMPTRSRAAKASNVPSQPSPPEQVFAPSLSFLPCNLNLFFFIS
jgi:hypothetical protein